MEATLCLGARVDYWPCRHGVSCCKFAGSTAQSIPPAKLLVVISSQDNETSSSGDLKPLI